nr:hypothetical protein CFP56_00186 [Quercus suber]
MPSYSCSGDVATVAKRGERLWIGGKEKLGLLRSGTWIWPQQLRCGEFNVSRADRRYAMVGPGYYSITSEVKCAENIGFVRCGDADFCFGTKGDETWLTGPAYVLPGMHWKQYDENGGRPLARATAGADTEALGFTLPG